MLIGLTLRQQESIFTSLPVIPYAVRMAAVAAVYDRRLYSRRTKPTDLVPHV